ncbi:carbohydrate ABC transporter permease [Promicromonospora sp. NPDC057488]|uniref:carbohydrate ABC transporter permease n=1 Tax=Promicromonospora sp. NPDC057488 TaxID=3346147 RepID=UPI00366DE903
MTARVLTKILLLVAAAYFVFPLVWMLFSVTKTDAQLATTFGFWFGPENHLVANFRTLNATTNGMFLRWVGNSVFYSVASAVGGTLFGVMAGYAIAKFRFPGRNLAFGVITASMLLPTGILTVPLVSWFHTLGLVNTIWAVLVPSCVSTMGVFLGMIYVRSSVPDELIEAARIDGAGEYRIFFTMVLRIIAPALVTVFLFMFVGTWNNFLLPLMVINDSELMPVSLGLYGLISALNTSRPAVILGALIGIIPLIILFFSLQKYWRAGLTSGAVKM